MYFNRLHKVICASPELVLLLANPYDYQMVNPLEKYIFVPFNGEMRIQLLLLTFLFLCLSIGLLKAQKTDTIIHTNGNVLTGEIKKLNYGVVNFKMTGMGTIKFKQKNIAGIKSTKNFEIRTSDGSNYFGSLDTSWRENTVKLMISNGVLLKEVDDLTELYPIKKNFWLRTSGAIDLGFDFSKGSDIAKLDVAGNLTYRKRHSDIRLEFSDNTTYQGDSLNASKSDVDFSYQRHIKNRWYIQGNLGLNSNSELGLRLRTYLTLSALKDLVHNHVNRLYVAVGPTANKEWSYGDEDPITNFEGMVIAKYHLYKFTDPEITITSDLGAYPSFTVAGRWRVNFNAEAKVEVIKDFYVGLRFYNTYDSKPIAADASTSDWGVVTTVGYSFH